jgi:hypothetical protein
MEDDSFRRTRPWLGVIRSSVRKGELWRLCTAGEALTELEKFTNAWSLTSVFKLDEIGVAD